MTRDTSPKDIRQRHVWRAAQVSFALTVALGLLGFWFMWASAHAASTWEKMVTTALLWPVALLFLLPSSVQVPFAAAVALYFVLQFALLWFITYSVFRAFAKRKKAEAK